MNRPVTEMNPQNLLTDGDRKSEKCGPRLRVSAVVVLPVENGLGFWFWWEEKHFDWVDWSHSLIDKVEREKA